MGAVNGRIGSDSLWISTKPLTDNLEPDPVAEAALSCTTTGRIHASAKDPRVSLWK